jgi:hypothetical protein
MPISYLQQIIAKGLALVDAILKNFADDATWATGGPTTGACATSALNVELNTCGITLADNVASLAVNGVALLQGMIAALGAFNG